MPHPAEHNHHHEQILPDILTSNSANRPDGGAFSASLRPVDASVKPGRVTGIDSWYQSNIIRPVATHTGRADLSTEALVSLIPELTPEADRRAVLMSEIDVVPVVDENPYLRRRPRLALGVRSWILDRQIAKLEDGVFEQIQDATTIWHIADRVNRGKSPTAHPKSQSDTVVPIEFINRGLIVTPTKPKHIRAVTDFTKLKKTRNHAVTGMVTHGGAYNKTPNSGTNPAFARAEAYSKRTALKSQHHLHATTDKYVERAHAPALKIHKTREEIAIKRNKLQAIEVTRQEKRRRRS